MTGAVLAGIGLLLLGPIVHGLGAKANTTGYTEDYVRILLIGTIFTMGNYTFGQLLRGEGSAKYSILGMTAGTVINIALDPVFIFALGLQVRGAAIATVLGNAVGMGLTLWLYASGRTLLKPSRRLLKPDVEIVGEIYRVGVPAALETLLTSAAFIVMNNLAVTYGELTVAAMGIAQKIMSLGMAVYGIFAPFLIGLFPGSPEVVETGSRILRALMCILPFVGATSMCRMSFQAMGKPMYALGITIVRQLVLYIPLLFLMNHLFHFGGLIWAQPVTELVMMVVSVRLLVGMIRRLQRLDLQKLDRPGTERPQS